jgi:hypothetical protein
LYPSGINNDVLVNLISTLLIGLSIKNLNRPLNLKNDAPIIVLIIAGIFTKQLIYFLLPGIGLVYLYRFITQRKPSLNLIIFCVTASLFSFLLFSSFNEGFWQPFWPTSEATISEIIALLQVRVSQLYREPFPGTGEFISG